jgi:hypothetical protein
MLIPSAPTPRQIENRWRPVIRLGAEPISAYRGDGVSLRRRRKDPRPMPRSPAWPIALTLLPVVCAVPAVGRERLREVPPDYQKLVMAPPPPADTVR